MVIAGRRVEQGREVISQIEAEGGQEPLRRNGPTNTSLSPSSGIAIHLKLR